MCVCVVCVHVHAYFQFRSKGQGISSNTNQVWQNYLEANISQWESSFLACSSQSLHPLSQQQCPSGTWSHMTCWHERHDSTHSFLWHTHTHTHTGLALGSCGMKASVLQLVPFFPCRFLRQGDEVYVHPKTWESLPLKLGWFGELRWEVLFVQLLMKWHWIVKAFRWW